MLEKTSINNHQPSHLWQRPFDWDADYMYQDCLIAKKNALPYFTFEGENNNIMIEEDGQGNTSTTSNGNMTSTSATKSDVVKGQAAFIPQYVLLEFEQPIFAPLGSLLIGSRLDTDLYINTCRIAFYGHVLDGISQRDKPRPLKIYKEKMREGRILKLGDRIGDQIYEITGGGLFKKETDISLFLNLKIETTTGDIGIIESPFGRTGKFRAVFKGGIKADKIHKNQKIFLRFQKYENDSNHKLIQNEKLYSKNSVTLCQMKKTILLINLRREHYLKENQTGEKSKGNSLESKRIDHLEFASDKNNEKNKEKNKTNNNHKKKDVSTSEDLNLSGLTIEKVDQDKETEKVKEDDESDTDTEEENDTNKNQEEVDYKITEDISTIAHDYYDITMPNSNFNVASSQSHATKDP